MVSLPSSSSSTSHNSSFRSMSLPRPIAEHPAAGTIEVPTRCYCGARIWIQTAMTLQNGGRRFLSCPKPKGQNCGFFEWIDDAFPTQAQQLIHDLLGRRNELLHLNKQLESNLLQTRRELLTLTENLRDAKGYADYLSGVDRKQEERLQIASQKEVRLLMLLKYQKVLLLVLVVGFVIAASFFI